MKMAFTAQTRAGRWAAGLSITFIVLMALKAIPFLPLPSFFIAAIGIAGFVVGIIAFARKEISAANILSTLIGAVIIFWIIGEIVYPH